MDQEQIAYHRTRASEEMELSLQCECPAAAKSHRRLAELHSHKARALETKKRTPFEPSLVA